MSLRLRVVLPAIVAIGLLAGGAGVAAGGESPQSGAKCPHTTGAGTTGDWEVVFGRRALRANAAKLLRRVRARGFPRAVIEREQCIFEVAVIGLRTRRAAVVVAVRAKRRGFVVKIMQS
jgi:hypothetical protein